MPMALRCQNARLLASGGAAVLPLFVNLPIWASSNFLPNLQGLETNQGKSGQGRKTVVWCFVVKRTPLVGMAGQIPIPMSLPAREAYIEPGRACVPFKPPGD